MAELIKVIISRHAKGRMKLYSICREDVVLTVTAPDFSEIDGENSVAIKAFPGRYSGYPLKVVFLQTGEDMIVVTVYPLKKKRGAP